MLASSRAVLLTLALLLAFELGVARQPWWWRCAPSSPSAAIEQLEALLIRPSAPPVVLILGSSRHRVGIIPARLEERLGLPPGGALNASLIMGTPFDALTVYRRNREKLSRARVLITGLDDWDINAALPLNDRDRRYATLRERWELYDRRYVPALMIGYVWRTYDANGPIGYFLRDFLLGGRRRPPVADHGRMDWERKPEVMVGPRESDAVARVEGFYWNYSPGAGRLKQLQLLIDLARADGVEVLVVRMPMRAEYTRVVRERYAADYAHFERALSELRGARVKIYESGSDIGIPDTYFEDYGHLTRPGSEIMTDRLADLLRASYGDLQPRTR